MTPGKFLRKLDELTHCATGIAVRTVAPGVVDVDVRLDPYCEFTDYSGVITNEVRAKMLTSLRADIASILPIGVVLGNLESV